jgi:maltose phosphorylase
LGYDQLLEDQEASKKIWEMSDITIEGDVKAQQGIRFIFQLNQTYLGRTIEHWIKSFTGESTEVLLGYDLLYSFYMATKTSKLLENLLTYRYSWIKQLKMHKTI